MHDDIRVMPPLPKPDPIKPKVEHRDFVTPEQVAAHDNTTIDVSKIAPLHSHTHTVTNEPKRQKAKRKFWPPTRKQALIISAITIAIIALAIAAVMADSRHKPIVTSTTIKKPLTAIAPKPTTVASNLSGLQVNPSANARPITAVMIENTPAARPQSGLSQAGVVFEALTEGGISRFMALYQDQLPTSVGPVRSVRPYYIDWALSFDAPIAHDGGSQQALANLTTLGAKNLDEMTNPGPYTRSSARPSPHNLYANMQSLVNLEANKGWTSSSFSGWPRKTDQPSKTPNATNISFSLSYFTYNVNYSYDSKTNSYNRSEGGSPQIDANTNKQLSPKVVVGMIIPWSQGALDTSNAYYSVYQTIGSGQAYVFQDGTLTIGQWHKTSENTPLAFTTASGQTLNLNAGQTWITALASTKDVAYN